MTASAELPVLIHWERKNMFLFFSVSKTCQVCHLPGMHAANEAFGGDKKGPGRCGGLGGVSQRLGAFREVRSPRILPQLNLLVRTFVRTKLNVLTTRSPVCWEFFSRNYGRKVNNNDEAANFKD